MRISETDLILNQDGSVYHLNLLPEHLCDKIITVGDPSRVHRVSQHFDSIDYQINRREFVTHVGTYKKKRITVISSGIGTDNVEILLTELDALANIDLTTREPNKVFRKLNIVRVGTSGAMRVCFPAAEVRIQQIEKDAAGKLTAKPLDIPSYSNSKI